nr:acyl carrier protein [Candidatus Njordarchaeota archaeon]
MKGDRCKKIVDDIVSKILLLEKNEIKDSISRKDVEEWDSMTHLILVSELEQAFDIVFSDDDVAEMRTIGDIKKALRKYGVLK